MKKAENKGLGVLKRLKKAFFAQKQSSYKDGMNNEELKLSIEKGIRVDID